MVQLFSMSEDLKQEAIELVKNEVTKYKDGEFFITENVAIALRPLIRLLRKNYWGIFDAPKDPVTNKDKQWVPLTRLVVDSVRKSSDIDLKDVNFKANKRDGIGITSLVRGFVRAYLYKCFFGETLNDAILQMCIDGTVIWKTYTITENKKLIVKRKTVDILNCFIDPTAESIQEAQRFTERALLSPGEIESMDWQNTENIQTASGLHRTELDIKQVAETGDFVDVYEMYGLIPERLITGKNEDKKLVDGRIVVSGIETGDTRVHLVERNTNKDKNGNVIKPYEELRYIKVPGRWAGVGPAEMVLKLQEWVNTIVNLRITKNTSASLGLFKIKAGSGITQQMLSNLVSRGVIKLNNMDDIDNFQIAEAGESSYRDEEVAKQWAFEVTSTYDIARGASLPASSTATSAVVQDRNAKTAFTLVIESIGLFLQRWMDRHFLPHVPTMMKQAKSVILYGDFDDIDAIRKRVATYYVMEEMEKNKDTYVPTAEELDMLIEETEAKLRADKNLFVDTLGEIITEYIDTEASFTNESTDVAVTVKNLMDMASVVQNPEAQRDFAITALDLLGLEVPESLRKPMPMMQDPNAPLTQGVLPPTEQEITTNANLAV